MHGKPASWGLSPFKIDPESGLLTAKSGPITEAINPLGDPRGWRNSLKTSDYERGPASLEKQPLLGPLDAWRRGSRFHDGLTLRHDFPEELRAPSPSELEDNSAPPLPLSVAQGEGGRTQLAFTRDLAAASLNSSSCSQHSSFSWENVRNAM